MTKRHIILFLTVVLLAIPARAQTFGAQEFTLQNGMQVVVIPNHRAPVVTHMIWIRVGGADNLPGRSGMAHYFEHLMFKGTKTMAAGDYSKTIKTLGGNDNAFTGQDYTAYFESVAVENLPKVMAMEADRMQNLAPPEEHFKSEKDVVIEERRQRTDNDPRAMFNEQLNAALFVNHPYGTPVIGWMDEIEKYDWSDVKTYYDTWYAPNNAILVVSGDITAEKLKPLAEKYYGAMPQKIIPVRTRPNIPPAPAQTLLTLRHPAIHQSVYQKIYLGPTEAKAKQESLALQVLAEIMNGGPTARLYKNIVSGARKATSVAFDYNSTMLDYGSIIIGGAPVDGVTPEELGTLLQAEIQKVIDGGVTEAEVKEAVQSLQDEAVFARDSVTGPAMIFGSALATGSKVSDVEQWSDNISKVTPAQIKAAAAKYLDDAKPWIRPAVTGYLLPATPPPAPAQAPIEKEAGNVQR
jgi:zinc protease